MLNVMASRLSLMVTRLEKEASIASDEKPFCEDNKAITLTIIGEAIASHNPLYSIDTLPDTEEGLVILLATAKVCRMRATKYANDNSVSGAGGFGQDRDTPYYKNKDAEQKLLESYATECARLGIAAISMPSISVSSLRIKSDTLGIIVPLGTDRPPSPYLSYVKATDGLSALLSLTLPSFNNFDSYQLAVLPVLLGDSATTVLRQEWNEDSSCGIPGLANLAEITALTLPQTTHQLKLEELDLATYDYKVVLVVRSAAGYYSYSNEFSIT